MSEERDPWDALTWNLAAPGEPFRLRAVFWAEEMVLVCRARKDVVEGRIKVLLERRLRGEGCAADELLKERLEALHAEEIERVRQWERIRDRAWKTWEETR